MEPTKCSNTQRVKQLKFPSKDKEPIESVDENNIGKDEEEQCKDKEEALKKQEEEKEQETEEKEEQQEEGRERQQELTEDNIEHDCVSMASTAKTRESRVIADLEGVMKGGKGVCFSEIITDEYSDRKQLKKMLIDKVEYIKDQLNDDLSALSPVNFMFGKSYVDGRKKVGNTNASILNTGDVSTWKRESLTSRWAKKPYRVKNEIIFPALIPLVAISHSKAVELGYVQVLIVAKKQAQGVQGTRNRSVTLGKLVSNQILY